MILGLEIGLAIMGILALIRGRMQLSKTKIVTGIPARLLGAMALTPFPIALVVILIYTMISVDNPANPVNVEKWVNEHQTNISLIEAGIAIGMALLIIVIAACIAKPVTEEDRQPRKKPVGDYDDYEERPRRTSRDDDYEDQPRRRAPRDTYEDDRPRRRDDLDERAQ